MPSFNRKPRAISANADAERGLSSAEQVHNDQFHYYSTIINLLRAKMNNSDCCFDTTSSDELIIKYK